MPIKSGKDNEEYKLNLKTPSLYPSLLFGPNFTPGFLSLLPASSEEGPGMEAVVSSSQLFLLLLPPQGDGSSHSSPAPAWGSSHKRLSFTNCSSVGPFHGVTSSFGHPSAPAWGSPRAAGESPWLQRHGCLIMGCTPGCRGISVLVPGAPPPPPSPLTLGSAGLLLSRSHSSLL